MDTQTSYKRTVAGSVGAGMGAIFNGSGRTYYMLEHKTSSKFHQAGETQKIIIDQVELGRDASCQVRFDESFDTVSRKHAAIERDGDNWKLVHLSASNPTLVNGRPIQGSYYLQSGDEIQLSVNGPRLGFIVPQGKQALTSSIKLTERMNLFRQQALRPYRRAIWVLGSLLALAVIGFGIWNYSLTKDNQALKAEMATYQAQMDSLSLEKQRLDNLEQQIQEKLAADPENAELKKQLADVTEQRTRVVHHYNTVYRNYTDTQNKIEGNEVAKNDPEEEGIQDDAMDQEIEETAQDTPNPNDAAAADDIAKYANDVYIIKIDRIQVEKGGVAKDPGIATAHVNVGTGFRADGGFITARCNIQPWIYRKGLNEPWRNELAMWKALGYNVRIWFSAYSAKGTTDRIQFDTDQINMAALESGDSQEEVVITKEFVNSANILGFNLVWKEVKKEHYMVPIYGAASQNAVKIKVGSGNIPSDKVKASSLKGGDEVQIAGYHGVSQHNVSGDFDFLTSNTRRAAGYFITLQNAPGNDRGYLGSPAFFKDADGNFKVVGVYVGQWGGEAMLVPLTRVN